MGTVIKLIATYIAIPLQIVWWLAVGVLARWCVSGTFRLHYMWRGSTPVMDLNEPLALLAVPLAVMAWAFLDMRQAMRASTQRRFDAALARVQHPDELVRFCRAYMDCYEGSEYRKILRRELLLEGKSEMEVDGAIDAALAYTPANAEPAGG